MKGGTNRGLLVALLGSLSLDYSTVAKSVASGLGRQPRRYVAADTRAGRRREGQYCGMDHKRKPRAVRKPLKRGRTAAGLRRAGWSDA